MRALRILVFLAITACPALATAEPIGIFSFDTLIPGPDGLNAFTISDLTGGFRLLPDFRVSTALTFVDVQVTTTTDGGGTSTYAIGDVVPGGAELQFADIDVFALATITFTLSSAQFLLEDGSVFQAASSLVSATLAPGTGTTLAPGDFIVLDVAGETVSNVPEPGTLFLFGAGILSFTFAARRRRVTP